MQQQNILSYNSFFFIGIAGVGMSAIAQYLANIGKTVSGSDRVFNTDNENVTKKQLEAENIKCYKQNGSGLHADIDVVVVSTAIENKVAEFKQAKEMGLQTIHRSKMLQAITESKKTIAISGTSGKSSTVAMLYHVLEQANLSPSFISGAGLVSLQKNGKIGNALAGTGEWLIIEADESDGSLVNYKPEIGVILNIDKDHKTLAELHEIFEIFKNNTKQKLIVNTKQKDVYKYAADENYNFGTNDLAKYCGKDFKQTSFKISFKVDNINFEIPTIGKHNMENALAAIAVANFIGVDMQLISNSLKSYEGIYRRMQVLEENENFILIDDYAHNPAKNSAAITACQTISKRVVAWFQPHGFTPTLFLKNEFISEISKSLRKKDYIYMSEIYYAGGTVNKNISANDLVKEIKNNGKNAFFVEDRNLLGAALKNILQKGDIILLMGARDPSLEIFANQVLKELI